MKIFPYILVVILLIETTYQVRNSGLNLGFKNGFFQTLSSELVQSILEVLSHISIVNYTSQTDMGALNFTLHIDYANVTKVQIDNSTTLSINNSIILRIIGFSIEFISKLKFNTTPSLFFGDGSAYLSIDKVGTDIEFLISTDEHKNFHLNFSEINFTISDDQVDLKVNGTNDIFTATQLGYDVLKPIIINLLKAPLQQSVRNTISAAADNALSSLNHTILFSENNFFDFGLLDNCSITGDSFMLYINGTGYPNHTHGKTPINYTPPNNLPDMKADGKTIQLYLSNYTINTISQSMYLSNMFNFNISKPINKNAKINLDTTLAGIFVPEIPAYYGPDKTINILINFLNNPEINFSNQSMNLSMSLNLSIEVNTVPKELALTIALKYYLPINIYLNKGVLLGNSTSYSFSASLISHSPHINITSATDFELLINSILQLGLPQLNSMLINGIPLNMTFKGLNFKDSIININDNYIEIGSTPILSKAFLYSYSLEYLWEISHYISANLNEGINLAFNEDFLTQVMM